MASATKPAPKVGVKQIAQRLDCPPTKLRAFIRTLDLGVGRGSRYAWPSVSDPTVKRIEREWKHAHKPQEAQEQT